jgi:hypothetical protein
MTCVTSHFSDLTYEELKKRSEALHEGSGVQKNIEIVKWTIYCSINGDNTFLDEKLAQLRSIDFSG